MNQAEALLHLQEIDLSAIHIQKRVGEIEAALADKQVLIEAQTQISATQQVLAPLQKKTRNLELEIQGNTEKIQTH